MTDLEKAADEYANSIAQHDHNKVFSIDDFKAGAEWQKQQMIDKACEWLKEWAYFSVNEFTGSLDEEDLIERFRVAMKKDRIWKKKQQWRY